jgi:hypothetical protein
MNCYSVTTLTKLPAYPTTSAMVYALWLRRFAMILPCYAHRYELTEIEVVEVQASVLEFITWLSQQIHGATQAIKQRHTATTVEQNELTGSSVRLPLSEKVATVVQNIRVHRNYCIIDGVGLGLGLIPSYWCFATLPAPNLSIVGYQVLDEDFAVALRWAAYPEAVIDLAVCRDGYTWQHPQSLTGECHADIYAQSAGQIPMQWQYRARYRRPDWPVGPWGEVVTVELRHDLLT